MHCDFIECAPSFYMRKMCDVMLYKSATKQEGQVKVTSTKKMIAFSRVATFQKAYKSPAKCIKTSKL